MSFKKKLEHLFKDEESIGVYSEDSNTGLRENDFKAMYPNRVFESVSLLPNGLPFFICTNSAQLVVDTLGEGRVYGFFVEDNPSVTHDEIISAGGHDFAVIKNRYIVDLWISHFTGCEKQFVYDLWDERDHQMIAHIFGDIKNWKLHENNVELSYDQFPKALKPVLRRGVIKRGFEPSM